MVRHRSLAEHPVRGRAAADVVGRAGRALRARMGARLPHSNASTAADARSGVAARRARGIPKRPRAADRHPVRVDRVSVREP